MILNSCKLLQNIFHKKKKKSNGASSRLCWNPPDDAPVLISLSPLSLSNLSPTLLFKINPAPAQFSIKENSFNHNSNSKCRWNHSKVSEGGQQRTKQSKTLPCELTLWALKYRWKETLTLWATLWALKCRWKENSRQDCLEQWERLPRRPRKRWRQQPGLQLPTTESWSSPPSQATQTAEVTSSSPQAVAYTSFSSLTFALLSSEHWGGEGTCPEVKDVQLKSHQSFQAALWAPGSQQPSHHAHPHQNEQSKLLPVRTKAPLFLQTDKNLLLYQKTIPSQKTERNHTAEI